MLKTDAKIRRRTGEDPLQNVVVRSVLAKMLETRRDDTEASQQESLRHISNNLLLFVERVHHENYPDALISGQLALPSTNSED